ncbi:MAG: FeoA domain-containing protein [Candidatus Bathyarchaeota archaeon]|nr:FeoA domain-containing protein [Candidatus Bathyarchaeota archaeon]
MREDVLRILGETQNSTLLENVKAEIKAAPTLISKALEELQQEGLIELKEKSISLTPLGQETAKNLLESHLVLEDYFGKTESKIDAHTAAHLTEHYVSREVLNNIKKLSTLKTAGTPLNEFGFNKEGVITEIMFSDYRLFERAVSMGIFPGEKIMLLSEVSDGIILQINNKKFALDKSIAKKIKALEYEIS